MAMTMAVAVTTTGSAPEIVRGDEGHSHLMSRRLSWYKYTKEFVILSKVVSSREWVFICDRLVEEKSSENGIINQSACEQVSL